MTAQAGPRVGKGYTGGKGPLFFLVSDSEGQWHAAAAMALRAACGGILSN